MIKPRKQSKLRVIEWPNTLLFGKKELTII
jgi:hypothetical protein